MNKLILFLFFISFALSFAQDAEPPVPPPTNPIVAVPPPGSTWTVTESSVPVTPDDTANPQPAAQAPKGMATVQFQNGINNIQHADVTTSYGEHYEFYVVSRQILMKATNTDIIVSLSSSPQDPCELRAFPFPGVSWISLGKYVGIKKVGKSKCYLFREIYSVEGGPPMGSECTVLVDVVTHFPVHATMGNTIMDMSPILPFKGSVNLPPAFQKFADKYLPQHH